LVDVCAGQTPGRALPQPLHLGPRDAVYASLEQAHAATSHDPAELSTAAGRALVETIFAERDGGWINVLRDPAFQNQRPNDRSGWSISLARLRPRRARRRAGRAGGGYGPS
jgi:hypothetical protein